MNSALHCTVRVRRGETGDIGPRSQTRETKQTAESRCPQRAGLPAGLTLVSYHGSVIPIPSPAMMLSPAALLLCLLLPSLGRAAPQAAREGRVLVEDDFVVVEAAGPEEGAARVAADIPRDTNFGLQAGPRLPLPQTFSAGLDFEIVEADGEDSRDGRLLVENVDLLDIPRDTEFGLAAGPRLPLSASPPNDFLVVEAARQGEEGGRALADIPRDTNFGLHAGPRLPLPETFSAGDDFEVVDAGEEEERDGRLFVENFNPRDLAGPGEGSVAVVAAVEAEAGRLLPDIPRDTRFGIAAGPRLPLPDTQSEQDFLVVDGELEAGRSAKIERTRGDLLTNMVTPILIDNF